MPDNLHSHLFNYVVAIPKMSGIRDLVHGEAELGSESEDEDFDEEMVESKRKKSGTNGRYDDSSDEDDEDDEEEAQAVSCCLSISRTQALIGCSECYRFERALSWKMKKSQKNEHEGEKRGENVDEKNVRKRKPVWMMRTLPS